MAQVPTGLHPSALALSRDGNSLYVANANSDTVTVIDTQAKAVKETILVRPDPTFPVWQRRRWAWRCSPDGKNSVRGQWR